MSSKLTDDVVESLRAAARKMTGFRRRQFQAEMALKHCDGSSRQAETAFGWRRDAVNTGLNELRTGIRCADNAGARGRKKTEEVYPQVGAEKPTACRAAFAGGSNAVWTMPGSDDAG